jgi:hypothetical protein
MMEDRQGWAKRWRYALAKKAHLLPVIRYQLDWLTAPRECRSTKKSNISRIFLFSFSGFFELSFAAAFISKWL